MKSGHHRLSRVWLNKSLKQRISMLLASQAVSNTNTTRIHLNFVFRYLSYQTKHVHSQNVEWNPLMSESPQRRFVLNIRKVHEHCPLRLSCDILTFFTVNVQHKCWSKTLNCGSFLCAVPHVYWYPGAWQASEGSKRVCDPLLAGNNVLYDDINQN